MRGLKKFPVSSMTEVRQLISCGAQQRHQAETTLNADSSRSHAVMTIHIEHHAADGSVENANACHLIDLAGSERTTVTDRVHTKRSSIINAKEGHYINKSLSVLANVISALTSRAKTKQKQKRSFIPYRDSKLTR